VRRFNELTTKLSFWLSSLLDGAAVYCCISRNTFGFYRFFYFKEKKME
jgi:hypothetical protein